MPACGEVLGAQHEAISNLVELRKAYDSIPRQALWVALEKLGVPCLTFQLIESFPHDMQAKMCLERNLLKVISVENGLRQGCCMAPVLFNLSTCLMLE